MKIEGAVTLVTGANGGIGKHYVEALKTAGAARIYAAARDAGKVADLVSIDPKRVIAIALDITNEKSIAEAAAHCQDVNLLINNAGIALFKGLIAAPDLSSARSEMEVNYFGTLAMCRAFAPILKNHGGGAIINMQSILSRVSLPRNGGYSASRAASLSMTQGVRAELAAQGTLVVAVMPATVDTDMSKNDPPPKVSPNEVAASALQAVIDGVEEIYPGEQATSMAAQLLSDPKAVEKYLATMLPTA
ncbi:SDR family oxidoreductase [Iningainema tapete]|uniref:SDR family oxidoreductase n=1 Tax=Iningainema tapete BLCC-T55 TaxID=2748662 RepID=A0A8J7C4R9_9CYAN|nr:SDR family oxidoreductase [Iningainema tapete]MBD2771959.1 SDR family oxidoreductase [Iningainema tapete BLCC-T55]